MATQPPPPGAPCLRHLADARARYRPPCAETRDQHIRLVQILRHAQFPITMEIYPVVSSAATRDALKRLGESLER